MSMQLLQRLSAHRLPLTVTRREDVDTLRILQAAGLVDALIAAEDAALGGRTAPATAQVVAITPSGWRELGQIAERLVFGR